LVLRIEFQQWAMLGRDLLRASSLRAFFGTLIMPPGWKADGEGETTQDLRRRVVASPAAP
jgi:hypothetical protein